MRHIPTATNYKEAVLFRLVALVDELDDAGVHGEEDRERDGTDREEDCVPQRHVL